VKSLVSCLARGKVAGLVGLAVLARIASAQTFLCVRGASSQPVFRKCFTSRKSCVRVPAVSRDVASSSGQSSEIVFTRTPA